MDSTIPSSVVVVAGASSVAGAAVSSTAAGVCSTAGAAESEKEKKDWEFAYIEILEFGKLIKG